MTEPVVLRHQRSLSKQHRRTTHQRPTGADKDLDAIRYEQVEEDDLNMPVALRHEACQRRGQRNAKEGRGSLAIGEVLRYAHQAKTPPLPCIRMPHVCDRQCATEWARSTQMEASLSTWCVSWPIAKPCPIGALVLNPRMGHVSRQFHVKFDDFFESVGDTPTNMDAPEPEWKYLSRFTVKKGATKAGVKGAIEDLLAPRRGTARTTLLPSLSDTQGTTPDTIPTRNG